ncbi:MAG: hypothetical protein AAF432_15545 [Planctomycetota bacterium]
MKEWDFSELEDYQGGWSFRNVRVIQSCMYESDGVPYGGHARITVLAQPGGSRFQQSGLRSGVRIDKVVFELVDIVMYQVEFSGAQYVEPMGFAIDVIEPNEGHTAERVKVHDYESNCLYVTANSAVIRGIELGWQHHVGS